MYVHTDISVAFVPSVNSHEFYSVVCTAFYVKFYCCIYFHLPNVDLEFYVILQKCMIFLFVACILLVFDMLNFCLINMII